MRKIQYLHYFSLPSVCDMKKIQTANNFLSHRACCKGGYVNKSKLKTEVAERFVIYSMRKFA